MTASRNVRVPKGKKIFRAMTNLAVWLAVAFVSGGVALADQTVPMEQEEVNPSTIISQVDRSVIQVKSSRNGESRILRFPLYEKGHTQYFSSGVGLEERQAKYPSFPLKLIFVQGKRAYLAEVAVTIHTPEGELVVEVPGDHVNGPWLFVNMPPGNYHVTATRPDDTKIEKQVRVEKDRNKVVYFRWSNR